jgi:hypothetical protein
MGCARRRLHQEFVTPLIHRTFLIQPPRLLRWPAFCDEKQEAYFFICGRRLKDMNLDRLLDADHSPR